MSEYTHRPTELQGLDPTKDRCVSYKGDTIARLIHHASGPREPHWAYHVQWFEAEGINGTTDTLADALAIVKKAHQDAGQPPSAASQCSRARAGYRWKQGSFS